MKSASEVLAGVMLTALAGFCQKAAVPEQPPISVCTALAAPLRFNGKIIALRGYVISTGEGEWLKGDCSAHLVTDGYAWPNSIWIASSRAEALHEVRFQTDFDSIRRLIEITATATRRGNVHLIWVTYEGMFETQTDRATNVHRD